MTLSDKRTRFQSDLLEWGEENLRSFPWREPDATPYEILVAEIFLKQTRASTVDRIHREFIERFPSLQAIREADRSEIIDVIEPLGLYNYRADAFKEIAGKLENDEIPSTESELKNLPQVGPYVANAILCFAFGENRAIIDTNVERIYSRVFAGPESPLTDEELKALAIDLMPSEEPKLYNTALLDFGSIICANQSPNCGKCFASDYCNYYQEKNGGNDI